MPKRLWADPERLIPKPGRQPQFIASPVSLDNLERLSGLPVDSSHSDEARRARLSTMLLEEVQHGAALKQKQSYTGHGYSSQGSSNPHYINIKFAANNGTVPLQELELDESAVLKALLQDPHQMQYQPSPLGHTSQKQARSELVSTLHCN